MDFPLAQEFWVPEEAQDSKALGAKAERTKIGGCERGRGGRGPQARRDKIRRARRSGSFSGPGGGIDKATVEVSSPIAGRTVHKGPSVERGAPDSMDGERRA